MWQCVNKCYSYKIIINQQLEAALHIFRRVSLSRLKSTDLRMINLSHGKE